MSNDIPRDVLSNISTYGSSWYTARALDLTLDNLADQIEDMGLNPIDFIWEAIDKERTKRARHKELLQSPAGRLWSYIKNNPWEIKAYKDNNGLTESLILDTPVVLPLDKMDIPYLSFYAGTEYAILADDVEDYDLIDSIVSDLSELSDKTVNHIYADTNYDSLSSEY
jgi:hypothetical protein